MEKCNFCNLNKDQLVNTIIEETNNFYITPALGSLVDGYLLIISKRHINSMSELNEYEKNEYLNLINKYRDIFNNIYSKYPIIFEHGTSTIQKDTSSSSIVHAHTHIVNHNYIHEKEVVNNLNFKIIDKNFSLDRNNKSYIFYINPEDKYYITYNFKPVSQIMRIFISEDLNINDKYNWRDYPFTENIINTINKFKQNTIADFDS